VTTITKTVTEPVEKYVGIRCDRCGGVAMKDTDPMEWAEFVCLYHEGGYASVFGDGASVDIDLCQYCLKEVLGEWLRVKE
jgi:hypothetical protein